MRHSDTPAYRRVSLASDLNSETLPQAVAPVWGAFLFEGLMTSQTDPYRSQRLLNFWSASRMKLVTECCRYLGWIWSYSRRRWRHISPKHGMFEYEVISAFGDFLDFHLILNHGELPPVREAEELIEHLVDVFFTREDAP